MALSPRQIEERRTRQARIVSGTLSVYRSKGIEGVTMDEIAKASGFGKATLYHYFPSKEEVIRTILEDGWKKLWLEVSAVTLSGQSSRQKLFNILKVLSATVQQNPDLYKFLYKVPQIYPIVKSPAWESYQRRIYTRIESILKEGITKGDFMNIAPGILMKAIGGIFHGLLLFGENQSPVHDEDLEKLMNQFIS
ncbi:MAG: TetR/AcrR family transcriptional regulator [FCB group bacterium]|nr:TetR/AcrR family transcriptional regulator [FCB group bacterium]